MKTFPRFHNSSLSRWAFLSIFIVISVALMVLAGWEFGIQRFKYPITELVGMNPATAISFIILAVSFLLIVSCTSKLSRDAGNILAILVLLAGLYKLISIFFHQLPQIDQFFYRAQILFRQSGPASIMASTTAVSFILSAVAVLLINKEGRNGRLPAHYFALIVLLFTFFTLLGYLYQAPEFLDFLERFPMAVHTAACFLLVSLALLLVHPDKGITKDFTATVTGNFLGRSLFFGALIIPVALGVVRIYFIRKAIFSPELGLTLFVCAIIIIFCLLIFYFLLRIHHTDLLRAEAEGRLRQSEEIFRSLVSSVRDYAIFMLDPDGNIITWNKGAEAINGYSGDEIKGKNISVFYDKEDVEIRLPSIILKKAEEKGEYETEGWRVRKDGSKFWADEVVTAMLNDHNQLIGYAKVIRDITETKIAKDRLNRFNEELKKQVNEKTRELQETTSQLRQLAAFLQTAREDERKSIAREIHDELGQMLTGIKMDVVWLRKKMIPVTDEVAKRFEAALELLNDTKETIRRISTDLHPAVLTDLGLVSALKLLSRDFENRSGIKVIFTANTDMEPDMIVSPQTSIALYRIFQESLTNVAKHANAATVTSSLKKEDNRLVLDVLDDGSGFDVDGIAGKKTLGLVSIRERVIILNGKFTIDASRSAGTHIHVSVPV